MSKVEQWLIKKLEANNIPLIEILVEITDPKEWIDLIKDYAKEMCDLQIQQCKEDATTDWNFDITIKTENVCDE